MNVDIKMVPLSKSDIYSRWIIQICLWILILSIIILTPIDHSMLYLYITLLFLWLYFCIEMSAFANIYMDVAVKSMIVQILPCTKN